MATKNILVVTNTLDGTQSKWTVNDQATVVVFDQSNPESSINAITNLTSNSLDEVKILEGVPTDDKILIPVLDSLKSDGKLLVEGITSREAGQKLSVALQLSGYINVMTAKDPTSGDRFATCQKPAWLRSSAPLKLTLNNKDLAESDLIDENDLLLDENIPVKKISGCGDVGPVEPGTRRACKNCTCGLAEEEAKGEYL